MKEEVKVGTPVTLKDVKLLPVVRTRRNSGVPFFFGSSQAVALVVVAGGEKKAFRVDGTEVTLAELARDFPGIEEALRQA